MANRLTHNWRTTDADLRKPTEISHSEDAPALYARASDELTRNWRRLTHCIAGNHWKYAVSWLRQFKIQLTQTDAATGRLACASYHPLRGLGNLALTLTRHPARKLVLCPSCTNSACRKHGCQGRPTKEEGGK